MIINVHAGHNPDGKIACGAIGYIRESTEARRIKDEVIAQLRELGHTVYDCTCENGTSQADVLNKIVAKCNAHNADLDVSIHFNAAAADLPYDGVTTGAEAIIYEKNAGAFDYADNVCREIASLGFRNRGVKINPTLYVLRKTRAPAMLIECCFVDDRDDVELYNYREMAAAIVRGIAGKNPIQQSGAAGQDEKDDELQPEAARNETLYRVQVGAYSLKSNADQMKEKLNRSGYDAIIVKA